MALEKYERLVGVDSETHKMCRYCRRRLKRNCFYANKRNRDGVSSNCKICNSLYRDMWRAGLDDDKMARAIQNWEAKVKL